MNKVFLKVLNDVNEGIVIIDENLKVCYWNNFMNSITGFCSEQTVNKNVFDVLPSLETNYFKKSANHVLSGGSKIFFSAAMHKHLINNNINLNMNLSMLEEGELKFLLLEFIDVTNQFLQINKLKDYINELIKLNKELKEKEEIIENLAYYDSLTGIANRTFFYKIAENMLENTKRNNGTMCLMFLDIDNFKSINDTYGHEAGDRVIVRVAEILKESTRKNDIIARYGGDEFLVLTSSMNTYEGCDVVLSRIANSDKNIIDIDGNKIKISLSIGVSLYPSDAATIDKLITKADNEMYIEKRSKSPNKC